jgi:hypothetical protein
MASSQLFLLSLYKRKKEQKEESKGGAAGFCVFIITRRR